MSKLRRVITKHPLTAFLLLTYLLSWWPAPLTGGQLLPYGPSLAAVVVLAFSEGRTGLTRLWRQMTRWRVGWQWYLIAPGIVLAYLFGALVLNLLLGATITGAARLFSWSIMVPLLIELLLIGGMWEEPGWSGYGLPKLQAHFAGYRQGLLLASLVMGLFRAIWHVPLLIYGHIPWFDVVFFSIAFQFLITWLYNRTGGSVLLVMLMHLTSNVVGGGMMVPLFSGTDQLRYYILFIALAYLLAFLLVRQHKWSMGTAVESP